MNSVTIYREFQQDGFPQLCEQGDNICQIKWYKSWKYVPTIISDRVSDLISVRIPQT